MKTNKGSAAVIGLLVGSIALVVALGVAYLGPAADKGDQGPRGVQGVKGDKGDKGDNGVGEKGEAGLPGPRGHQGARGLPGTPGTPAFGATPGADFYGPYWGINDVKTFTARQVMTQSTSTICSLRSPAATSTLVFASVSFRLASTVATAIDIARDTPVTRPISLGSATLGGGGFATSSLLISANYGIAANVASTIFVTPATSTAARDANFVFGPDEFFVVKAEGAAASTNIHDTNTGYIPTGICNAVWIGTELGS